MSDTNRNGCIQWEVTFPQCGDADKSTFHKSFPPAVYVICAKEEHVDGGFHLHMGLKLKKKISFKNMLKYIEEMFPNDYKRINVSAIQSWAKWNDYCAKENPPFIWGSLTRKVSPADKLKQLRKKYPEMWDMFGLTGTSEEEFLEAAKQTELNDERIRTEIQARESRNWRDDYRQRVAQREYEDECNRVILA